MAATNPATAPGAEAIDGDNLTAPQASLLLAILTENPDAALEEADELYEAAGYPDGETMVDELLTYLSGAAGTPDTEGEADDATEEADPNEMEAM